MKKVRAALVAATASALMLSSLSASAQVVNPGFELPVITPGGLGIYNGGGNAGGWDVVGTQVMLVSNTYTEPNGVTNGTLLFNAHSGLASMDLTGAGNNGTTAGVQQSIATMIGQNYTLSFWVGRATGNTFYGVASTVDLSIDGGSRVSFTNSNTTADQINWQQFSYGFTASAASTQITFFNGTASSGNNYVGLDDVTLTTSAVVTPEPASVVLLGAGLAGIAGFASRRQASKTT